MFEPVVGIAQKDGLRERRLRLSRLVFGISFVGSEAAGQPALRRMEHPKPKAFCICANAAFAIYLARVRNQSPLLARVRTRTQRDPTIAREAKEVMETKQSDSLS